ncbi:hypothetical protein CRE_30898 [Caenorhabditis remanei]|uniref:Nucleotide-diphospho-sugar transferase domain-containing protein n=1 Tax=Caenorhabditis remanei TaxID=31234 RepID=E3LTE1_CAERE|nr:hypothetical protein CRE_30898 [Caenorhabditis remanei]
MLDHKTHYQNDRKSIQISHKAYLGILIVFTIIFCFFTYSPIPRSSRNTTQKFDSTNYEIPSERIGIVAVITNDTNIQAYEIALKSVECYAKVQGYSFVLARDSEYECQNKDKFFRRHCVVSKILSNYSTLLFLDADIGVVNPKKRIEEYLDDNIDITFYDRHFNFEVAMGSYILKNTPYAKQFFEEFAAYESKLPNSVHGTDNGALHVFLAEKLFPHKKIEIDWCRKAYNHSKNFDDLATYEVCIRAILGAHTDFGKVRIMSKVRFILFFSNYTDRFKGTGWVRDAWLTSGVWSPDRDFMLHGWKTKELTVAPTGAIKATEMSWSKWYNPFSGQIELAKCFIGNTTWSYNEKLIQDRKSVDAGLLEYEKKVSYNRIRQMGKIFELVNRET